MTTERLHRACWLAVAVGLVSASGACERSPAERSRNLPKETSPVATVIVPPATTSASPTTPRPAIKRDPFKLGSSAPRARPLGGGEPSRPAVKTPPRPPARPEIEPSVTVQGVMVWEDRGFALIDGKSRRVGDRITASGIEWVIRSIDPDKCTVTFTRGEGERQITATLGPNL